MAGKILVAVFSASGVTGKAGEEIARIAGAHPVGAVWEEVTWNFIRMLRAA